MIEDINEWYIELYEDFPRNYNEEILEREGVITRQLSTLKSGRQHSNPEQFDNPSNLPFIIIFCHSIITE